MAEGGPMSEQALRRAWDAVFDAEHELEEEV
jgi:hypothetical protein